MIFGFENFTSVFCKTGGNFNFEKNVEFLEFLGFTLCFRTFQAKKIFFNFFNLRAKRGGSLFEAGSEREENGGVASVQKWCA